MILSKIAAVASLLMLILTTGVSSSIAEEGSGDFPAVPSTPVVAHRGFSRIAPENTLPSIEAAIEIGAQGCEFDLYQTADGVIYLNHDSSLKRVSGVDVQAGQIRFEELRKLDAGLWKGEKFRGTLYPTLDEALERLNNSATRPVIEVKADGIEEKLVAKIREMKMEKTVIIIDFSAKRVKKFREIAPEICTAWLVSFKDEETVDSACQTIIRTLTECKTNVVDMHFGKICPELLDRLRAEGIHVMCWTVDSPADIDRLVALGVESITTNSPDVVLESLKNKKSSE